MRDMRPHMPSSRPPEQRLQPLLAEHRVEQEPRPRLDDAAQAGVAALAASRPEPLYVVSDDRPVTRDEYYTRMANLSGAPPPRFAPAEPRNVESARDATNKRVFNRRMKLDLVPALQYPEITTGLAAALARWVGPTSAAAPPAGQDAV